MLKVIYEDNHLLVVEKPVKMPVQADSSCDPDLLTEAKRYIKQKYDKPGDVYLGLVHRLDRPVGGVIVFARTSKAAARLTEAMKTRRVEKRYAAITDGGLRGSGTLVNYIVKDEATHSALIVDEKHPGAQKAVLEYSTVTMKNGLTLADIGLMTGRHHQIRAQFAAAGHPLYGDQRYNPEAVPGQQIALFAYSLSFEHPTLKEKMTFTSVPTGGAWADFHSELTALTCGVRCVYIDENVIAVNKQAGIACAIADGGEDTLEARLAAAFGEVYPVHRLDVPTTGLVLFARNPEAEAELSALIRERKLKKYYRTRVFGIPKENRALLSLHQEKDPEKALVRVYDHPTAHSREMLTRYELVKSERVSGKNGKQAAVVSLLEVELLTGRTHQIRSSLAYIGCPVVGDDKYGDREKNRAYADALELCAVRLVFPNDMKVLASLNGKTLSAEPPFGRKNIRE